ncbi:MAG: hypothetical protein JW759_05345 [Candidatus Coatesbacteria bacterium]|nr:hypothetical protein [Candidatus Coatesbacteria bacterium]
MNKSDTKHYHGGYLCDEMAALVSLSLGIRLQAGPMTREFSPGDDPKGRPAGPRYRLDPVLSAQAASGILIPNALRDHNLNHEIHSLKRLNELSAEDATALVHAARSYQEAIWIADSDPALSWLMFVTAAEIAAKNWKKESYTPLDKLQTSRPVFAGWLRTEVEDHVLQRVAEEFAVYAGVTKKFIEFLIHFLPEPPEERARIEGCRCSWSEEDMRDYMGVIYHHRSRALHDGIPFPWPMWCPHPFDPRAEKPCGEGCSGMGGSWTTKDTPMVLWTFEYIVRNALLKWWAKMLPEDRSS